jgi:hypothetical protein
MSYSRVFAIVCSRISNCYHVRGNICLTFTVATPLFPSFRSLIHAQHGHRDILPSRYLKLHGLFYLLSPSVWSTYGCFSSPMCTCPSDFSRVPSLALTVVSLVRNVLQRRHAHENPVIFYSVVIGAIGPVGLMVIPPIRTRLGYTTTPPIPTTYPSTLMFASPARRCALFKATTMS